MKIQKMGSFQDDSRQRLRVGCNAQVQVQAGDGRTVTGRLRDVGLESLYLFTDKQTETFMIEGDSVQVKVTMQREGSTLTIETDGQIVRMDDTGFAVRFASTLRWWPVFIMFPSREDQ